jgi:hypothetical protein
MDIDELKRKADAKGVDVLVSVVSGTCKAVMPEHRKTVVTEQDEFGIYYTDEHVAYVRMPKVSV